MSSYIINATNGSDTGTIIPDVGFNYTDKLNDVNESNIKISGTGSVRRGLLKIGSEIEIKKDGTRVFYGLLDNIDYLDGGAINFHVSGYEIWFAKKNGAYASSPYKTTASATIFSDLIGESTKLTAGTINAGSNIDFRMAKTDSLWNGISNLARKVSQDTQVDYINLELDILDHRGSTTSVLTFNDSIDIDNLRKSESYPLGNKIIVYGKGDGANQVTATASDATSIAEYGEITRPVTDRTIMSESEAQKLADAEKLITKDPVQIYDFDVMNPNQSFIAGDVITLNSTDKDLDNADVRIVGIEKGMRSGVEYLTLQVTNSAYSALIKNRNNILSKIVKQQRDNDTYMQGSGNTQSWARGINAKLDTPLVIPFYVSSDFVEDEAGNMRITSLTLDYDIDPYRKGVGSSSETQKEPNFAAVSAAASHGHSPYETGSGHDHANPATTTGVVLNTQDDITGDYQTETEINLTADSWNTIETFSNANIAQYEALNIHVDIDDDSGTLMDVYVRVETDTTPPGTFYPNSTGVKVRVQSDCCSSVDIRVPVQAFGQSYSAFKIEAKPNDTGCDTCLCLWWDKSHTHNISTFNTNNKVASLDDSNQTPAVTGKTVLHAHDVTVGDDISDATDVNANEVDIYLDHYENKAITNNETAGSSVVIEMADTGNIDTGDIVYFNGTNKEWATVSAVATNTSITATIATNKSAGDKITWVNKHIIMNTGKILDYDVDITDTTSYPDATGFWRVRINPNHASPDLVQGIIRMKFHLDS